MATWVTTSLADVLHLPLGTMHVQLLTFPNDAPAITGVPTDQVVFAVGRATERVDLKAGEVEIEALDVTLDDASAFFWNILTNPAYTEVHLQLVFVESGVQTPYFRGRIDLLQSKWTERYVNGGTKIRVLKAKLVSTLEAWKSVTMDALITDAKSHMLQYDMGGGNWNGQSSIRRMLASACRLAWGNTTWDIADVVNNSYDVRAVGGSNGVPLGLTYNPIDCEFIGQNRVNSGPWADTYWFDRAVTNGIPNEPASLYNGLMTAWDFLVEVCRDFGFVPRHFFGQSDGSYLGDGSDRHRIELQTRGRNGNLVTMVGGLRSSEIAQDTDKKLRGIRMHNAYDELSNTDDYYMWLTDANVLMQGFGDPGKYAKFDEDGVFRWMIMAYQLLDGNYDHIFYTWRIPGGTGPGIMSLDFWNYQTGAWQSTSAPFNIEVGAKVACLYFYNRFSAGRRIIVREYSDMRATYGGVTSHRNIRCMARTQIDGVNYYATEVSKDVTNNRVKVTWIQE